jgi:prepilin-type N-terminal cleavage/methylation domain-containing protein
MVEGGAMKGFTLIELLVVITIIGILAAIGITTYLNQVERARDAEAKILLASLAVPIMEFRVINGKYPADVNAGVNPGIDEWPTVIPFDSVIDFEHWSVGNNTCVVIVTHFGRDGLRGSPVHTRAGDPGSLTRISDDFIKTVTEYPCNKPRGSVR